MRQMRFCRVVNYSFPTAQMRRKFPFAARLIVHLLCIHRFGRLIHGSEAVAKDVLEYCVFEKHLSNVYGTWRLHGKIIPDWMPKRLDLSYGTLKEKMCNEIT